ncbi:MAG: TetR/AcrR family transcriptional regulator [Pseudoalteromonas sp.]
MISNTVKPVRRSPKTLDRDHVLDVAMDSYWKDNIGNLSLNEICRRSGVSKPGLYREFSNEDGLMKAVLIRYQEQVLEPVQQMLNSDVPFKEALDNLISFATSVNCHDESPNGCLFIKMRESRVHLGKETQAQIDFLEKQGLVFFKKWVERSKTKGEFYVDMSSEFVATYIDAQLSNASTQLARGVTPETVKKILLVAFSVLE